ncbi:MAG: tetratricopeptide repeat protein [Cellvibrionaceae bacterium]|nr:tetratricopeptide repeat protein [Cellvibrionaceae bacterium]
MLRFSPLTLAACALCLALGSGCQNKKTSQDYLSSGDSFYQQQQWEKARIEYRNALALDPASAQAHYGLASIARDKQEVSARQFHLGKAVQLKPDEPPGSLNTANSPCSRVIWKRPTPLPSSCGVCSLTACKACSYPWHSR